MIGRRGLAAACMALVLLLAAPAQAQRADPWNALAIDGVEALNRGATRAALDLFLQALQTARGFAPNDQRVINSLLNVAVAYGDLDRPDQAEIYYLEAIRLQEAAGDPDLVLTLDLLGQVYAEQGLAGRAVEVFRDAIARVESIAGADHPYTALVLEHLGDVLFALGRYDEVADVYGRIVEIRMVTFGPDHRSLAPALTRQGMAYIAISHNLEAAGVLKRALVIWRAGPQPPSSELLLTLGGLVEVSQSLGRVREAAHYQLQVVVARAIAEGERGPRFADELEEYARQLRRLGDTTQADQMEARAAVARIRGETARP